MTDANLVLGRLSAASLLGGDMRLDADLAARAVEERVARPLGLGLEEAAEGVIRVVNAAMLKGIRVVSVAKGYDPREFCVAAFGGAGPLHASELARELDIPRVLVPIAPGVTSALGLLMADMRHDYVRTVLRLASESPPEELTGRFADMEEEALAQMEREGISAGGVTLLRLADARYLGQGFELEVPVDGGRLGPTAGGRPGRAVPRGPRAPLRLREPREPGGACESARRRAGQPPAPSAGAGASGRDARPGGAGAARRLLRRRAAPGRRLRPGRARARGHPAGARDSRAAGRDDRRLARAAGAGRRPPQPRPRLERLMSRGWLIGGGVFLAALLAGSVAAALLERDASFPEGSAEAVVQRYVKAVEEDDWEAAHALLAAELREECPVEELFADRGGWAPYRITHSGDRGDRRVTLEETRTLGETLLVTVSVAGSRMSGPFGVDRWSYRTTYSLAEEDGEWRFSEYPDPFYDCPGREED